MKQKNLYHLGRLALVASLALAGSASAGLEYFQKRDDAKFVPLKVKPFKADKDVVAVIMREGIPRGGGYTYQYPRENPEPTMTDKYAAEGDLSMEIELIASDYSGVAVAIAGSADLTPYMDEGVLEFWIKGEKGGENALLVLIDDGVNPDGESIQVKLRSKSFGEIEKEWKRFSVPLKLFGTNGEYWDIKNAKTVNKPFNWKALKGFRLEVRKDENASFKVWIDDIVLKSKGPEYQGPASYPFRNEI